MVKISTLFHRVDGFEEETDNSMLRELPQPDIENHILTEILEPLLVDPGEDLVQKILHKV